MVTSFGGAQISDSQDGVAVLGDYIFVVDAGSNEVEVFNKSDNSYHSTIDVAAIDDPTGLAAGNGLLFVGDEDDDDIDIFSALPPFGLIQSIVPAGIDEVTSLAFSNGNLYLVDDIGDQIVILSGTSPHNVIGSFPVSMDMDAGVAVAFGLIYVITSGDDINVYRDQPGYPLLETFNEDDIVGDPECIFADGTTIYVVDDSGDEIHVFSAVQLIPTMGQWALMILAMLLSSVGLVFLYNKKSALA